MELAQDYRANAIILQECSKSIGKIFKKKVLFTKKNLQKNGICSRLQSQCHNFARMFKFNRYTNDLKSEKKGCNLTIWKKIPKMLILAYEANSALSRLFCRFFVWTETNVFHFFADFRAQQSTKKQPVPNNLFSRSL